MLLKHDNSQKSAFGLQKRKTNSNDSNNNKKIQPYLPIIFRTVNITFVFAWVFRPNCIYEPDLYMSLVMRKPVFGVFDQVRLKPACSAVEACESHEISNIETRDIVLSRQWTTKVLIRQRGCTGWSVPLLFTHGINRFFHDVAHIVSSMQFSMLWHYMSF